MRKRAWRRMTDCAILAKIEDDRYRAMMQDFTRRGAMIKGLPPLEDGEEIDLVIVGHEVVGRVRWQGNGRTGVSFSHQLPETIFQSAHR